MEVDGVMESFSYLKIFFLIRGIDFERMALPIVKEMSYNNKITQKKVGGYLNLSVGVELFTSILLAAAILYFLLFAKNREWYIRFWGLCWIAYSISLILLILHMDTGMGVLLSIRKIFDLTNILLLLFGAYAFMHREIPTFWYRFGLYVVLWFFLGIFAGFGLPGIYLPVSLYELVATAAICIIIYRFWTVPKLEKILSILIFSLWGTGKAALNLYEAYSPGASGLFMPEILLSNILTFAIFIIYIQKTREEMVNAQRLYQIVTDNLSDMVFYYQLNPAPSFQYVSPSAAELTGYGPERFYQNPKLYRDLADPSGIEILEKIFRGEEPEEEKDQGLIFQAVHRNGTPYWCEIRRTVLRKDGRAIAIEGILRGVSRMKEAELNQEKTKQARDLLLSSISHELKTPVTAIAGYVNALTDGTLKSEEERDYAARVISTKALSLERLIEDLTQLSKLESRQFPLELMMVSAAELARELIEAAIPDLKAEGQAFEIHCDYKGLAPYGLIADPKRILQAFMNLVYNSIKYSDTDEQVTIRICPNNKGSAILFQVEDRGIGIPKEELPYIFERFYRAHKGERNREIKGSGLGLTIAKEIINGHGGGIHGESAPGRGSLFTFELPVYNEDWSEE